MSGQQVNSPAQPVDGSTAEHETTDNGADVKPVDTEVQEEAAREREKSGGYQ